MTKITREAAFKFVREIFEDCFPQGKVERVPDFYAPEVIGHMGDGDDFDYEDIVKRYELNRQHIKSFRFEVEKLMVFDEFIFFSVKESWIDNDRNYHELFISVVYRVRNWKIYEIWGIHDIQDTYKQMNQHFSDSMRSFIVQEKEKINFMRLFKNSQYIYHGNVIHLTLREQETLYYYLKGLTSKEIAEIMQLSARTIESYIVALKNKFGCATRAELRVKIFPHTTHLIQNQDL